MEQGLLWYVVIYSFLGFLLEISFARIVDHPKKDRKCFLLFPLCPVYGIGALLIHWLAALGEGPVWVMISGFLGAGAAELGMGVFYRHLLGVDFWDYSKERFHIKGLVCLRFSLYWTVLALVLIYVADPMILNLVRWIPDWLDAPMTVLLSADAAVSALALRRAGSTDVLKWYV